MKKMGEQLIRRGYVKYDSLIERLNNATDEKKKETINRIIEMYYENKNGNFEPIEEIEFKVNWSDSGDCGFIVVCTDDDLNEVEDNWDFTWEVENYEMQFIFNEEDIIFTDRKDDHLLQDEYSEKCKELWELLLKKEVRCRDCGELMVGKKECETEGCPSYREQDFIVTFKNGHIENLYDYLDLKYHSAITTIEDDIEIIESELKDRNSKGNKRIV